MAKSILARNQQRPGDALGWKSPDPYALPSWMAMATTPGTMYECGLVPFTPVIGMSSGHNPDAAFWPGPDPEPT
jgi:hypothetical protein